MWNKFVPSYPLELNRIRFDLPLYPSRYKLLFSFMIIVLCLGGEENPTKLFYPVMSAYQTHHKEPWRGQGRGSNKHSPPKEPSRTEGIFQHI